MVNCTLNSAVLRQHRCTFLRRDEDYRGDDCNHIVFFAWLGEEIVARRQLHTTNAYGSGKYDDLFSTVVGMTRKLGAR